MRERKKEAIDYCSGRVAADLVEAFEEMAAHLRGEIEVESYDVPEDVLAPARIKKEAPRPAK